MLKLLAEIKAHVAAHPDNPTLPVHRVLYNRQMQAISDITAVYDPLSFCLPEAERVALNAPAQLFWEYGLRYWGNTSVQVHSTARRSMGRSGSGGGSSPHARPSEVGQW